MKEPKKHQTIDELRNHGLTLVIIFIASAFSSGLLFLFGLITYGLIASVFMICCLGVLILVAVKIHARHTQDLIYRINDKKPYSLCDCEECKSKMPES